MEKMEKGVMDATSFMPQFSLEERDRRWRAIREEMILHKLDCLLIWSSDINFGMGEAHFRYVTHIAPQGGGAVCIFPLEGEPIVFAAAPHMVDRPYPVYKSYQHWIRETRAFSGIEPAIKVLRELGYERANIGWVAFIGFWSEATPYRQYSMLMRELDHATLINATPLLDKVRVIKSAEEIQFMEKAGSIARKKIDIMIKSARPGIKECELYAKMIETGIANGEEAVIFNLLTSGSVTEKRTQHLLHGNGPAVAPTTRPLQKGDIILAEVHTQYGGYIVHAEKSLFLGDPPKELERVHAIAVDALAQGTAAMKPGVALKDVWAAFHKPVKEAGFDWLELGFHAHGITSPEYPTFISQGKAQAEQVSLQAVGLGGIQLRENMVFGQNVDVHDPKWRNDVGVIVGDTVVITKDGARQLVNVPLEFVKAV